ncbi:MAG: hypothetical protein ISR84_03395 [Kiritimatiellales bacterium]|nr:hypothetical protein [Kiritimatiellota bacterium]MBL7016583.1 hypothetical protein [Kiritimatiellales bacterium]
MIDPYATRAPSARQLWSGYVQHLVEALDLHERETASDVSESLAVFCEQHPHMPEHTLSLLMARSFCVAGDSYAAGRVLLHDRAHRRYADSWLEVLSVKYPFPELYPLFSSRALRPLRLQTVGREATWVLDLGKINLSEADRHEMILWRTLRVLTESASNVWKSVPPKAVKPDGCGTLVVKGLPHLASFIRPRAGRIAPQMIDYLQDVLSRCAERNGWSSTPSVLLLDL